MGCDSSRHYYTFWSAAEVLTNLLYVVGTVSGNRGAAGWYCSRAVQAQSTASATGKQKSAA